MNKIKPKTFPPAPAVVVPEKAKAPVVPVQKRAVVTVFLKKHTVMILDDNKERVRAFEAAVGFLSPGLKVCVWHDAPSMKSQCRDLLADACLISLDHDLTPLNNASPDPGTGLEVAEFLSRQQPACPVIIHTSNHERRWSMHNEFRFAGWNVEIIPPIGDNWIQSSWLPKARALIGL